MNFKYNEQLTKHEITKDLFMNNIYNIFLLSKRSMVIIYVHCFICGGVLFVFKS